MKSQGYSRDKFYILKKQRGEESMILSCRVPPMLHRTIGSLIASRVIPQYETVSDFIQNALVHQLVYELQDSNRKHDAEFQRDVQSLITVQESKRRVDQLLANSAYIDDTERIVEKSWNHPERVKFLMNEMEVRAKGLAPELADDIYESLERIQTKMRARERRFE